MGKQPAFQFYPNDWSRDLEEHPLEIEGAWIRICCKLWWADERGKLHRTIEQWARILRIPSSDAIRIINYIKDYNIGNVTCNADVTQCNSSVTVINRRMYREHKDRENTRLRVRRHRKKRNGNGISNANITLPSSSSSSKEKETKAKKVASLSAPLKVLFDVFWKAYPKKVDKQDCVKWFKKHNPSPDLVHGMVESIEVWRESKQWEDMQFIPSPYRWLNGQKWEDELPEIEDEYAGPAPFPPDDEHMLELKKGYDK